MNLRFKEIFIGRVVNKRLTFNSGMDEFRNKQDFFDYPDRGA